MKRTREGWFEYRVALSVDEATSDRDSVVYSSPWPVAVGDRLIVERQPDQEVGWNVTELQEAAEGIPDIAVVARCG